MELENYINMDADEMPSKLDVKLEVIRPYLRADEPNNL